MKRKIAALTAVVGVVLAGWLGVTRPWAMHRSVEVQARRTPITTTTTGVAPASTTVPDTTPATAPEAEPAPSLPPAPEREPAPAPYVPPTPEPPPPAPVVPGSSCSSATAIAAELVALVNQSRAENGLGPMTWSGTLGCNAQSWSEHMASVHSLYHQDLSALFGTPGYEGFNGLAENIMNTSNRAATAAEIHNLWMSSPAHRANILGSFDTVGLAVYVDANGWIWATQEFAKRI